VRDDRAVQTPRKSTTATRAAARPGVADQSRDSTPGRRRKGLSGLRVLEPDHPDTLTARGNLARWLGAAGQPGLAADQYRDLLTDFLRSWDPTTPTPSLPGLGTLSDSGSEMGVANLWQVRSGEVIALRSGSLNWPDIG
jgi:hypothetical protein